MYEVNDFQKVTLVVALKNKYANNKLDNKEEQMELEYEKCIRSIETGEREFDDVMHDIYSNKDVKGVQSGRAKNFEFSSSSSSDLDDQQNETEILNNCGYQKIDDKARDVCSSDVVEIDDNKRTAILMALSRKYNNISFEDKQEKIDLEYAECCALLQSGISFSEVLSGISSVRGFHDQSHQLSEKEIIKILEGGKDEEEVKAVEEVEAIEKTKAVEESKEAEETIGVIIKSRDISLDEPLKECTKSSLMNYKSPAQKTRSKVNKNFSDDSDSSILWLGVFFLILKIVGIVASVAIFVLILPVALVGYVAGIIFLLMVILYKKL